MSEKNLLVILAAGFGERYGAEVPKQFTMLNGRQVLEISVTEMKKSNADKIIIVINDDNEIIQATRDKYNVDVIAGGDSRVHSLQKALDYIYVTYPDAENVVIHEAARPMITYENVNYYYELLKDYDYIETCKKIVDFIGSYKIKAPKREDYYLVSAPEAYRISVLKKYFDCESPTYFAAHQLPEDCKGIRYFGIKNNIKLTNPEDKDILEMLLSKRNNTNED